MSTTLDPVELLLEFDKAVSWPSLDNVTAQTLSFFDTHFDLDRVTILLFNGERSILNIYTHDTSISKLQNGKHLVVGKDISAHFLSGKKPAYFPVLSQKKALTVLEKKLLTSGFKSYFSVPLIVGDVPVGSLNVASLNEDGFNAVTQNLMVLLSSRLALALYHARLHDELVEKEDLLAVREKSYRELVDQAGDVILKGSAAGLIIQANDAATRLSGYSNQELLSTHIATLFDPAALIEKPLRFDLLEGGLTSITERLLHRKDGTTLPVEMNSKKLSDGSIVSILRDLSDRKATNDMLLDQKNQISALLDAVPTPLYAKDKTGHYTMLNDAFLKFFGKTKAEMLGKTATDCWPTAAAKQYSQQDSLFMKKNKGQSLSLELRNAAGEKRQVIERKARFMNAHGEISGFVGAIIDYTDLKAAEDRYQMLFTYSPDPIVVHDGEVVLAANQAAVAFFKADDPDAYIGTPVAAFLHPNSLKDSRKRLRQLFSSKQANELMHQKFIISDGTFRDVEVMAVPIKYDGHMVIMTSFRDITIQKQAQDLLRSSEENYRNLIEATPTPIVVHVNNALVYANPAALEFAGIQKLEDFIGLDLTTLIHPDSLEGANKATELIAATRQPQPLARRMFLRANGEVRQVESMGSPINFVGQEAIMVFFRDITDELLTRDELSMTEERYRRAFNYSPTAMVLHDNGILVDANQAALDFSGAKNLQNLIGQELFRFVHKDYVDISRAGVAEILRSDSAGPLREQKFLTLSGQERWVEARGFPVHQGGKSLILISFNDIHDRVMARKQLEENRQQLELITQHLTSFLILIDLNFNFLYLNSAASEWLGKTNEELVGLHVKDITNHAEFTLMKKFVPQLLKGEVCYFPHHSVSRSGRQTDVWITLIPVMGENGEALAFLAQVEDITEREAARKELADNKELLELIVDTIPGLFSYVDVNENYLYVNKAYADWHGKKKSNIIGKTIKQILPADTYRFIRPFLSKISTGEEQFYSREVLDRKDQKHILDVHYIPHLDSEGKTKAFLTSLQDVTSQRNAESRQKALQDLAFSLTNAIGLRTIGVVSAQSLRSVFDSDAISMEIYDYEKEVVLGIYNEDTFAGSSSPKEVPLNDIPFAKAPLVDSRFKAVCINRQSKEQPGLERTIPFGDSRLSNSLLYVPLRSEGVAVGVVSVQSYTKNKYQDSDLTLLQSFADQIGVALIRAQRDAQLLENQKELEKEEQKYRSIIENAGDAVFVTSLKGKIQTVNENACVTSGYTEAELLQMNISEIDSRFFKQLGKKRLSSLKSQTGSLTLQSEHLRKDQSSFPVEIRVGITEIDKQPSLLCFARDVTERNLATLREQSLRNLAHALNESVSIYSAGKIAAKTLREVFNSDAISVELYDYERSLVLSVYTEDTFLGRDKPKEVSGDDIPFSRMPEDWLSVIKRAQCENRTGPNFDDQRIIKFGDNRPSRSLLFAPVRWEHQVVGMLSVQSYVINKYSDQDIPLLQTFADQIAGALIRTQKEAQLLDHQKALEKEEQKYRSIIENAGDAVFVTTFGGQILTVNEHACRTLGYTGVELIQMNLKTIDLHFFRKLRGDALTSLKNGAEALTLESEHHRQNGSRFPVELQVGITEIDGQSSLLIFARDISERKLAETRERALRKLAHDLNESTNLYSVGELAALSLRSFFDSDAFTIEFFDTNISQIIGVYSEDTFQGENRPRPMPPRDTPFQDVRPDFFVLNSVAHIRNRTPAELLTVSSQRPFGSKRLSHSLLFAPIIWGDKHIGVLTVQSYTDNKYSEKDIPNVQTFADQIGSALVRAKKDEELAAKQAELQESELKYRSMIENAGDALFVASFQGQILAFNQHATASLGYNESELLTLRLQTFCPEFYKTFSKKRLSALIKSGASLTLETHHFRKDGSAFPVELRVGTMELKGKQCILFFARDVSERKENEVFRASLGRLARQLTVSLDPRQVGEIAATILYDLFDYDTFAIYKISLEQSVAIGLYGQDTFINETRPVEVKLGIRSLDFLDHDSVFAIPSPVLLDRRSATESYGLAPFGDVSRLSKCLVFVPVFFEGVQIGLFSLQSYTAGKFTEADLPKLKIFANQLGGALVRAQTDELLLAQTASLKEHEQELETLLQEKEVLLKEVYHRTKNNMQVVVGLLEMYSLKTKNVQTRGVLGEMTNRIYSMSMVHDLLYRSKNLAEIILSEYLDKLVTRLVAAYKTSKSEIDVLITAEPVPINIQIAVPLGLVINEIVTNSLKYAFPGDRDGQIEISARVQGENGLLLSIKDSGVGLKKGFDLDKSKTLGMRIIQDIVQLQLFGELIQKTSNGVEYIIQIPDLKLD